MTIPFSDTTLGGYLHPRLHCKSLLSEREYHTQVWELTLAKMADTVHVLPVFIADAAVLAI